MGSSWQSPKTSSTLCFVFILFLQHATLAHFLPLQHSLIRRSNSSPAYFLSFQTIANHVAKNIYIDATFYNGDPSNSPVCDSFQGLCEKELYGPTQNGYMVGTYQGKNFVLSYVLMGKDAEDPDKSITFELKSLAKGIEVYIKPLEVSPQYPLSKDCGIVSSVGKPATCVGKTNFEFLIFV